jgi:glycosyltransferase involved in cell wall biosynthesis
MNILIIPHLPTLYGRRYNLAKSLAAQGHTVHFITWDNPYGLSLRGMLRHLRTSYTASLAQDPAGFTVHKMRRLPLFWPIINGLLFKRQIRNLYAQHNIDIIISQSFTNETEPPLDLPFIYDMNDDHAAFAAVYGSRFYKVAYKLLDVRRVIRRQCQHARIVTVVSDRLQTIASAYNNHVVKIPNGVETATLKSSHVASRRHAIVYVSTFGKWAQGVNVVTLVSQLKNTIPDIHLDLIGGGTELPRIRQKIAELGAEAYVTVHGWINDRATLFHYIAAADVCLNISEKNAFRDAASPMKVIDYTAAGKKVVSTDLDEVRALNFPNVCIYDAAGGLPALQEALLHAFAITIDSKAARNVIRRDYTWTSLTHAMLAYLEASR